MGLEWLAGFLPSWDWLQRWLDRYRHPPRIELDLNWRRPWLVGGDRHDFWRSIKVRIIAGKTEELVVAKGDVQARVSPSDPWTSVGTFREHWIMLNKPIEIAANRGHDTRLVGKDLAEKIEAALDPQGSVEIRLWASDHHGTEVESEPLETSLEELRATRIVQD